MRFATVLLLLAGFVPQDKPEDKPCDMATVEEALWCAKCKKVLEKEHLEADKCKECKGAPEKIRACVKTWIPRCGMHGQPHKESCCKSKFCCKPETVKRPVLFTCAECGKAAFSEALAHDADKAHVKKVSKKCETSGTQPHGGAPLE